MKLQEIEQLVEIVRGARVSELTVSTAGTTVRLKKPLTPAAQPVAKRPAAVPEKFEPTVVEPAPDPAVTALMVGIFHSVDGIKAGSAVESGQVVGMIESMKLMNEVVSDRDGVISEMLIENDMPVEYGQILFRIKEGSHASE